MSDIDVMDVNALINTAGGVGKLAAKLSVSHATVCDWKRTGFVPGSRAAQISQIMGIPSEEVLSLIKPVSQTAEAAE